MGEFIKKYDIFNKIIAVCIGATLWAVVINIENPIISSPLNDLVVEFSSLNLIQDNYDLVIVSDEFPKVDIKLKGSRDDIARLSPGNTKVIADLSGINKPGEYEIDYTVKLPFSGIEIVSKYPEKLHIVVDEIQIKKIPVKILLEGEPARGFVFENISNNHEITISGPSNELEKVVKAQVNIDVSDVSKSINGEYEVSLIGESDKVIKSANITQSNKAIKVSLPISKVKEVPVEVDLKYGSIVSSKKIAGYEIDIPKVTIIGAPSYIDSITSINLGVIDIDQTQDGKSKFLFNVPQIENIKYLTKMPENITVSIQFTDYETRNFDVTSFVISEELTDLVSVFTETISIQISGSAKELDTIAEGEIMIEPVLDIGNLQTGQHEVDCKITIDNSYEFDIEQQYKIVVDVK